VNDIVGLSHRLRQERQSRCLFLLLLAMLTLHACGKKGAPLPPLLRIPATVGDPIAARVDDEVFVRLTVPTANVDGHAPGDVARIEVYALTADRAPTSEDDPEKLRQLSTLVATQEVRRPLPPLPPAKPGEPEPVPLPPGPGVDQGAQIVVRDRLTPAARVPVILPRVQTETRLPETASLPGPLVAPDSPEPVRYYYAVAVNANGRYGVMQNFLPVPLGSTSSAPSAPKVTYDAKALTITWAPPRDARGIVPPTEPGVLPSRSLGLSSAPTTYDVYEVARDQAGNASPTMPTALTPAPVAEFQVTAPLTTFGTERCFLVRPVDIVHGYHVRGPASPTTCVTPADTFPPSPPTSLAAVANADGINLIWDPSDTADVVGYMVLRSRLPDATLAPAMEAPISETSFIDRGVRPGVTYAYVVVAVDRAGNRSEHSNRIEETARQ
jgi:hypothetical protein